MKMFLMLASWELGVLTCTGIVGMDRYPSKGFSILFGVCITLTVVFIIWCGIDDEKRTARAEREGKP